MTARFPLIPRTPGEAVLAWRAHNGIAFTVAPRTTLRVSGDLASGGMLYLRYKERAIVEYYSDGGLRLMPEYAGRVRRGMRERFACVLPPDWTIMPRGERSARLLYRGVYVFTFPSYGVEFRVNGSVDIGGDVLTLQDLNREAEARADDPPRFRPRPRTRRVPAPPAQPTVRTYNPNTPPYCWCYGPGNPDSPYTGRFVLHGEFSCFRPPTPEEAQAAWDAAQTWLQPAIATYRADNSTPAGALPACSEPGCSDDPSSACEHSYCDMHCACPLPLGDA